VVDAIAEAIAWPLYNRYLRGAEGVQEPKLPPTVELTKAEIEAKFTAVRPNARNVPVFPQSRRLSARTISTKWI